MRKLWILLAFFCLSCEKLIDIEEFEGPCTIVLVDGSTIQSHGNIEILKSTGVLTYKDKDGKLWSLTSEEYQSYECSPS